MSQQEPGRIKHKTLIIWGEEGQLFSIDQAEAAAQLMSNARLLCIRNAGHLPLMDQPDIFNRILTRFLGAREDTVG